MEASDRIFSEMMVSIERRRSELKELIRDQQQTAVAQTEALLRQLEEHMEQLERRHADLEELSNTDDIITFIQVPHMAFYTLVLREIGFVQYYIPLHHIMLYWSQADSPKTYSLKYRTVFSPDSGRFTTPGHFALQKSHFAYRQFCYSDCPCFQVMPFVI